MGLRTAVALQFIFVNAYWLASRLWTADHGSSWFKKGVSGQVFWGLKIASKYGNLRIFLITSPGVHFKDVHIATCKYCTLHAFNPLTPVPPVTAHDEPWPFFHFWRHHLWPNLASSILNFCRRKRSFQWCLVHSDWLIGTANMPKNAQKVERKTRSQISCHYT